MSPRTAFLSKLIGLYGVLGLRRENHRQRLAS
jgi:hypothetical protein